MSEPAKKPQPAMTASDARVAGAPPPGYTLRFAWINLLPKDLTIGGSSLYQRVDARKLSTGRGTDIYWSREDRHYWIGRYDDAGQYVNHCRVWEGHVGTSGAWEE